MAPLFTRLLLDGCRFRRGFACCSNRSSASSGKHGEQIPEITLARRISQQRTDAKDLFHRAQGRAMVIVDEILIAVSFCKWRKDDHADRSIADLGFIPGDEQRAALVVSVRVEDRRHLL